MIAVAVVVVYFEEKRARKSGREVNLVPRAFPLNGKFFKGKALGTRLGGKSVFPIPQQ